MVLVGQQVACQWVGADNRAPATAHCTAEPAAQLLLCACISLTSGSHSGLRPEY